MAFDEDFDQFIDTNDFGVEAAFTPSGGSAVTIKGIYDDDYVAIDGEGMVQVSGSTPVFHCKTSDVSNAYQGTLVVNSKTYEIVEVKPDGTGMTMLVLEDQT